MKEKLKIKILSVVTIMLVLVIIGQGVYASTKEPGSEGDPIITQSYLESEINKLKNYINQKISSPGSSDPSAGLTYEVVELKNGQCLIAGAGTEVILRSGKATAVVGKDSLGGLSDVTGGSEKDIEQGEKIPANHLLVISRDDGRGICALMDSFLLVRGKYTIK